MGEIWQSVLEQVGVHLPLPTLIATLHRLHCTPQTLHKWPSRDSSECPRCVDLEDDHIHMFWNCPKLVQYWSKIIIIINLTFKVHLNNDPLTCILGYLDEELFMPGVRTALTRLLFLAHKCVLLKWIAPLPPKSKDWRTQVNSSLLKEKHIFNSIYSEQSIKI